MQKTKTYFTTEAHGYLDSTPCADARTCTVARHWSPNHNEFRSLRAATTYATSGDDAPAVRILKVTTVIQEELIKTIAV